MFQSSTDQSTKAGMFGRTRSSDASVTPSLYSFGMRRRGAASLRKKTSSVGGNTDNAVSTTKAHLISIVAPRLFTPETLLDSEDPASDKTVSMNDSDSDGAKDATKVSFHPSSKQAAGYSAGQVMASPFAVAAGALNNTANEEQAYSGLAAKEEQAVSAQADKSLMKDSMSSLDDSRDDEEDDEEGAEITPEEALCIKRNDELDNTEVNVEHLLRVTFKNLFKEKYLVSAPTFTIIDGPAFDNTDKAIDAASWIQIEVMVLPPAIGVVLQRLERIGVGHDVGSVSIYKAELCKASALSVYEQVQSSKEAGDSSQTEGDAKEILISAEAAEAARNEWKMAATRLRVEQVREQIVEGAEWNFDFIALVTIAAILAGTGLVTNNTVVIVASMLVSPIMGPVMGMTFGARIAEWPLVRSSFVVETKAILVCFVVGFFVTLCAAWTTIAEDWPTNEMQIRGDATGLIVGIVIAVPSGMGVSLSILGGNTGSLVGVAISASLLPPAVNAGICWMYALIELKRDSGLASDYAYIGAISIALTIVNIVCIWFSGMLMFTIKEVAPLKKKNAFWERDLKVARKMNRHEVETEPAPLPPTFLEERAKNAFDLFSFNPFRRTPMEVTVKHNAREVDFGDSRPLGLSGDLSATSHETADFDDEEADAHCVSATPHCWDLSHLFGGNQDSAPRALEPIDPQAEMQAKADAAYAARKKNIKYMYYRQPSGRQGQENV